MKKLTLLIAILITGFCAKAALAVPSLQLFIEGAIYDAATETWVTPATDFNLQVIGSSNVIEDVYLAIAVPTAESGTVSINGTPVGPFTFGTPTMGDGNPLPGHGIYPADFATYFMGDFGLLYPVFDMQPGGEAGSADGEIKTVAVSITGYSDVHFDAYDHIVSGSKVKYRFAPFSHDAEHNNVVPEPSTLLLLGSGLLGSIFLRRKRNNNR